MNLPRTSLLRLVSFGVLVLVPAALAGACTNVDVPIGSDQQPIACNSDADCPNGDVCSAGFCTAGCVDDADCGADQSCVMGACIDNNPVCNPSPELCDGIDNDCDGQVDNGATCNNGVACVNGSCGGVFGCMSDADCGPAQQCINGVCGGGGCQPAPEVCDGVDNDCDGQVDEGASCPAGQSCVSGACVSNGGGCASDADCAMGFTCINGLCCGQGACGSPEVCDGIDNDNNGMIDDGATCNSFFEMCVNGACVAPCASDSDCSPMQTCVNGYCSP